MQLSNIPQCFIQNRKVKKLAFRIWRWPSWIYENEAFPQQPEHLLPLKIIFIDHDMLGHSTPLCSAGCLMKDIIEIYRMLHVMNSLNISFLKMNNFTFFSGNPCFFLCFMTFIYLCVIRQFDHQLFLKIQKHANILDFLIYFYYNDCIHWGNRLLARKVKQGRSALGASSSNWRRLEVPSQNYSCLMQLW